MVIPQKSNSSYEEVKDTHSHEIQQKELEPIEISHPHEDKTAPSPKETRTQPDDQIQITKANAKDLIDNEETNHIDSKEKTVSEKIKEENKIILQKEDVKLPTEEEEKHQHHYQLRNQHEHQPQQQQQLPPVLKEETHQKPNLKESQLFPRKMFDSEKNLLSSNFKVLQSKTTYHDYMKSRQVY